MGVMAAGKRVALVTGGTRGIGAAIVRGLASEGFAVAISGRTESSVREAVERFRNEVETNLCGPYYAIHYAAPLMKKGGGGFIVNIGSLAAVNAFAGGAAYNASKFGLLGLSDAAMLDLRHDGIRIALILPGSVETEFSHSHRSRESSWMLRSEDVARAVAHLVRSPDRATPSRLDLRPSHPPKK